VVRRDAANPGFRGWCAPPAGSACRVESIGQLSHPCWEPGQEDLGLRSGAAKGVTWLVASLACYLKRRTSRKKRGGGVVLPEHQGLAAGSNALGYRPQPDSGLELDLVT